MAVQIPKFKLVKWEFKSTFLISYFICQNIPRYCKFLPILEQTLSKQIEEE